MKTLLFAAIIFLTACSSEKDRSPVFASEGKAIKGYDPVAFHTEQKPVAGNDQFAHEWNGARWLFSSQAHLDSFKLNPGKYAPQYGGYCAFGTSRGYKAPTDINAWTIHEGKLYLNYNSEVKQEWNKDRSAFIQKADSLWPQVKDAEF